jgi:hypothetical protein
VAGQAHEKLPEELLEEKVTLAMDYLAAMDILDPGISHNRGIRKKKIFFQKRVWQCFFSYFFFSFRS